MLRFPIEFKRYVEVFGGGGWVLFHKPQGKDMEIYNDFNRHLTNLFRCVRDQPEELKAELQYMMNSRIDFIYMRELLKSGTDIPDLKRAAYFYALIRYSYGAGADDFSCQPHSIWTNFPLIDAATQRLQKVIIECKDFQALIEHYDRNDTFFYCDPPYFRAENTYAVRGFTREDHERLAETLFNMKGKFLLSYNDCPQIRELYNHSGIFVESVDRLDNLATRYEGGKIYHELFISNYDTREFLNSCVQMSLFKEYTNQLIGERKIIYDRLNEIHTCTQ